MVTMTANMDEKLILCEQKISPLKINEAKYFEEQRLLWNSLIVPITEPFIVIFWKRLAKEALLKIENFMKRGYRQHQIKFTGILIDDDEGNDNVNKEITRVDDDDGKQNDDGQLLEI